MMCSLGLGIDVALLGCFNENVLNEKWKIKRRKTKICILQKVVNAVQF